MIGHVNIKLGVANGADVVADVHASALTGGELVKVSLTHDYARNPEPGFLVGGTPAGSAPGEPTTFPHTIPAGTTLSVTSAVASALIGVGAATII